MPYDLKENASSITLRLSRKKIIKKTLKGNIILIIVLLLSLIVYLAYPTFISEALTPISSTNQTIVFLALTAIILVAIALNFAYQYLYYKTYYYNIKDDILVIRKGVFIPDEISIPFNRIQDIYVDRDFLDLILGLYDVHVSSATVTSEKDAHIDGLTHKNAVILKEMILDQVRKSSKEKTPL